MTYSSKQSEKNRRNRINERFGELKDIIPSERKFGKNMTKEDVLSEAIEYIRDLQKYQKRSAPNPEVTNIEPAAKKAKIEIQLEEVDSEKEKEQEQEKEKEKEQEKEKQKDRKKEQEILPKSKVIKKGSHILFSLLVCTLIFSSFFRNEQLVPPLKLESKDSSVFSGDETDFENGNFLPLHPKLFTGNASYEMELEEQTLCFSVVQSLPNDSCSEPQICSQKSKYSGPLMPLVCCH